MKINRRKFKKSALAAAIITFYILTAFTGCKKNEINMDITESANHSVSYKVNRIVMDNAFGSNAVSKNGLVYYISNDIESMADGSFRRNVSANISDEEGNIQISIPLSCELTEDNIYVDDSGNITCIISDGEKNYRLMTIDSVGNILSEINLDKTFSDKEYLYDCLFDSNGNIFCNMGNCVRVLDSNGSVLFTTKEIPDNKGQINSLILTGNDIPAAHIIEYANVNVNYKLAEIDLNSKKFDTEYKLPFSDNVYSGIDGYLCTIVTDSGIYGINANDLQREKLLDFLNSGIVNAQICGFFSGDDGSMTAMSLETEKNQVVKVIYLIKSDSDMPIVEKKILTLGGYFSNDYVMSQIAEFNRTNEEYTMEFVNYRDRYYGEEYSAVLSQLDADILAGTVPDILIIEDDMPFDSYASKGLFADLYGFIDNDPELDRKSFLPNVLNAMETNGKLYGLAPDFLLESYVGKASHLGRSGVLTIDRANELLAELPDGARIVQRPINRNDFVLRAVKYGNFVDYENGICSFDTPAFIKILEAASYYPDKEDFSIITDDDLAYAVMDDMALIDGNYLTSFDGGMNSYSGIKAFINDDVSFMGFPTANEEGSSGAMLDIGRKFAISSTSEGKQAAWEFIRNLLVNSVTYEETDISPSNVSANTETATEMRWVCHLDGFPVLSEQLNSLGKQSTDPIKNINDQGEIVPKEIVVYAGSRVVILEPLTPEDVNEITQLILSTNSVVRYDKSLESIISEEISYYFGGARSAEKTADMIQSRASIYLSEQYR